VNGEWGDVDGDTGEVDASRWLRFWGWSCTGGATITSSRPTPGGDCTRSLSKATGEVDVETKDDEEAVEEVLCGTGRGDEGDGEGEEGDGDGEDGGGDWREGRITASLPLPIGVGMICIVPVEVVRYKLPAPV